MHIQSSTVTEMPSGYAVIGQMLQPQGEDSCSAGVCCMCGREEDEMLCMKDGRGAVQKQSQTFVLCL